MKKEKRTLKFLESLLKPESAHEDLVKFCLDYISEEEKKKNYKELDCRHIDCCYFGTLDGNKGPGVRKTTLAKAAKSSIQTPHSSTKIRSYHIAFFSKFSGDIDGLEAALRKIDRGQVIRHLCGCLNCTNPIHLELGTVADSFNDRGIHLLLETAWNSNSQKDFKYLMQFLGNNNFDQF